MVDRDLASAELWERSLERSRRRRAQAAARHRTRVTGAQVSAALLTGIVVVPVGAADGQTMLRRGSEGAGVAAVQRALGIPADGVFGPQTRAAVRRFQRAHGLEVDGIVGPITARALGLGVADGPRMTASASSTTVALQRALGVPADGEYGPVTRAAVRRFQASRGLAVDGVAGPATLGALGLSGPTVGAGGSSTTTGGSVVAAARSKLGQPYEYGGEGDGGWDCSGLVQWAFAQVGVSLPRTSFAQFGVGTPIDRSAIQAGDLVYFNAAGPGASHVAIATSNSMAISATTRGVMEHPIGGAYWGAHYVGARRM
jgi:cell wall-associated NlpC family hydrolase